MSYCETLTSAQVRSVLDTEKDRMRRHSKGSSVWNSAQELVFDAKNVLAKRGEYYG